MMHRKLGMIAGVFALLAVGTLAAAPMALAATLTDVSVSSEGKVTKIHVSLDAAIDFDHFTLSDPDRFVLDCIGVENVTMDAMPAGSGLAKSFQADVWKGAGDHSVTRIMIDLSGSAEADVQATEGGIVVTLMPEKVDSWTEGESNGEWSEGNAEEVMDSAEEAEESDSFELTAAEEEFEFAMPVRPTYDANYERGNAPSVTSFEAPKDEGLGSRGGSRVSLDVQGADISTVLRSISEYSGANIVVGYDVRQTVTAPVSFHLKNVPWGDALEMVLQSAKLWYREDNGIIRVDTEENLRQEELDRGTAAKQLEDIMPLTTRIVNVIYASARELARPVSKSLTSRGVIEVDHRTNSLVVTDINSRVDACVEMIQHLDSQTPQVEIVAKLVEVDARYTRDLGVLWGASNLSAQGGSAEVSAGSNSVVDPGGSVRFGLVRSWGEISSVLSALESENKANIISNPRITTVNNREAKILVGKKIPLIVLDEAGNAVTQLITIGITLLVNPHINDNNRITLDLHPEVSDLSSQATVQGGVIINTSEADTRVMVGNGETAVIGGLIRSNESTFERGLPILRDLPIVGGLFGGSSTTKEKRELLIFVTPRIVSSFANHGG
ncbi:MAG: type IV pilus secretin PilQ [Candidatus Eisenbacteria bacterium]|uniref:Type IV pilus secretin PilQ n=1 Tax=Eiseniibacteriota bacterium TaxID=2212470 RepID=A0A7Y2H230_UNCEI|nr:type IV pilus secretin PilQ [Candidatus Eisenbacteria bacterium]